MIDRAGILRYAKADAFSLDDLNAILVPLLRAGRMKPSDYARQLLRSA
jgi:hypothetical protein